MSTLLWIVAAGTGMAVLALSGSLTLVLPERQFTQTVLPLATGSLLGGALFHMLPESVGTLGNHLSVYVWLAAGLVAFLALEQALHWHHCHRPVAAHRPLGHLILVADSPAQCGWASSPGWSPPPTRSPKSWATSASWYTSAGPGCPPGSTRNAAPMASPPIRFAPGNFIYIALADLVPELTTSPVAHEKIIHTVGFTAGLTLLLGMALIA